MPHRVCDDSTNIDKLFSGEKFDLVFSCPPYADLEVYSDDPRDLSNMKYVDFMEAYREIIRKSCAMLNDNRFAVFVVGEVREKSGVYYNFVADTIAAFRDAGLSYYNEMILATQIGSMAVRIARQFNASRKIGKVHQNVLVFYKGDTKHIKSNYPEMDFSDDDIFVE
jgi:DNA modification methylase